MTQTKPVTIPGAERFDLPSAILGRTLRILIARPAGEPPKAGWPVVYLLDGFENFATAARLAGHLATGREIREAVVVGVAYADPANGAEQRRLDLTLPVPQSFLDRWTRRDFTVEGSGGLDAYLKAIETEVKPAVAATIKIDPKDQTLFGHSLGGLAVLRSLFTRAGDYQTYLASSPSIWWGEGAVLADEAAFAAKVEAGRISPRIFVCVGRDEGRAAPVGPESPFTQAEVDRMTRRAAMVANARALAGRLSALTGTGRYQVESVIFSGEGHLSVIPSALSRGLRFALR
jgi:predicted alpha/beta superfamily hydrolase